MVHRRNTGIAVTLAAVMSSMLGCSHDLPTSSHRTDARAVPHASAIGPQEVAGTAFTFIVPEASGTVRKLPELGVFEGRAVLSDMQSSYFRTTADNREFRRGFAEFIVPSFTDVFSARIVLRETRAGISLPVPPDRHELSYYTDVDLLVDTSDYDRRSSALGTFETDANLETGKFEFDVSRLVAQSRGARLGFRMKMEADPTETAMRPMGTAFGRSTTPCGVRIEVTTTPAEANDLLQGLIRRMGLPAGVEASLLAPLQAIGEILGDGDPANDDAACARQQEFLDLVASLSPGRQLNSGQAWDLAELGRGLMTCERGHARVRVFNDFASFEAATRRLVEVDFESGSFGALSIRDPAGVHTGFCSAPTCTPDADNPKGGNIQLFLSPGSTIAFPPGTGAVMLVVEGMGDNPFQVQVTDDADNVALVDGAGISFGVAYLGFTSPEGISRIDLLDVGGTHGPLVVSAVFFGDGQKRPISRHPAFRPRT